MIEVEGVDERNKIACRIVEQSSVNWTEGNLTAHSCGFLVSHSSLIVNRVTVARPRSAAIIADSADLQGAELVLSNIPKFGIVTLGNETSVSLGSMRVDAEPRLENNLPVYATAGRIEIAKVEIADCDCCFFVDPKREFIDLRELTEKLGLKEPIGLIEPVEPSPPQVAVFSDLLILKKCKYVWVFNGAGTSRVKQINCDITGEMLLKTNKLTQKGADLTNFEISEAK